MRGLIAFALLLLASPAAAAPRLTVWTVEPDPQGRYSQADCARFWADYNNPDTGLAAALKSRYDVVWSSPQKHPIGAGINCISRVPTFVSQDVRIIGYTSPADLLQRLGLASAVPTSPTGEKSTPPSETGPAAEIPPFRELPTDGIVDQLGRQAAEIDRLKRAGGQTAAVLQELRTRIEQTNGTLQTQGGRLEKLPAILKKLESISREISSPTGATPPAGEGLGWGALLGRTLTAFGVGGPIAAGAVGGVTLLTWLLRRKKAKPAAAAPARAAPVVITTEAPSATQAVIAETRFTTVERDTFAEAFAWAKGELGRKEPGAIGTLEALDGLTRQYLASKGVTPNGIRK